MEAAAALSPPRVALDARALFSPPPALPASPSSHLRLAARPRALAASPATAPKPRFLSPHPDPAGRGARDVVAMVVPFLRGTAREQPPPDLASFLYKNRIVYLGMCLVPSVTELMLAEFLYLQYEDAEKPIYLYINSTGTTKVVPFLRGTAREQPPPDLASFLYKNRIVYLGMCLVPSVTELMLAEFLYLQYEDAEKPIYLYINSTGTTKNGEKLGYETEAFAIYDAMRYVKIPIYTLCVGNAWGEAALLLAAGAKGNRAALPSSTIMIKQPIGRFQGQATDVDIARKEIRNVKMEMVKLMSRHIGKPMEEIARDIRRPKYFSPSEAMDYGIIDKVLYNEKSQGDGGVVSELKRSNLI